MTRLARPADIRVPSWTKGIIEGMDASVVPLGSLADAENLVATPAERLAVRGGSSVVNTLHDSTGTELTTNLRLDAFTPTGMIDIGWSAGDSAHYLYRLTPTAAFFTGTEATSRSSLVLSPFTASDTCVDTAGVAFHNHTPTSGFTGWEYLGATDYTMGVTNSNQANPGTDVVIATTLTASGSWVRCTNNIQDDLFTWQALFYDCGFSVNPQSAGLYFLAPDSGTTYQLGEGLSVIFDHHTSGDVTYYYRDATGTIVDSALLGTLSTTVAQKILLQVVVNGRTVTVNAWKGTGTPGTPTLVGTATMSDAAVTALRDGAHTRVGLFCSEDVSSNPWAVNSLSFTSDYTASWNVGPRRPMSVELYEQAYICDATATYSDRQSLVVCASDGTITQPRYTLNTGPAAPMQPLWVEEYNNVLFVGGYGDELSGDVPNMVRHSFLGQDPADPVSGFNDLAYNHLGADGVPVVAAKKGRGLLLVFKPNEIYRVTGFGNAYPGWQYQVELVNNTFGYGVSNPWAVTFAEDYWYGWGQNGPFRTDGYTVESLRGPREVSWRLLNSFDLYWVEYHPDRRLILFGVHPAQTSGSRSTTVPWETWGWDLARQVWQSNWTFGQSSHSPDYGAGFDLSHAKAINTTVVAGPTGPPSIAAVSMVGTILFEANWVNGDSSAQTEVWVSEAAGVYYLFATANAGASSQLVTPWLPGDAYTVKVRHVKAGVTTVFSEPTGWQPSPYPTPNPPTAITGATSVAWTDAILDHDGLITDPAVVSFVIAQALDTLKLYSALNGLLHTWTSPTAGTVVTAYAPYPGSVGSAPTSQDMYFVGARNNYTVIQTPNITVNA